MHFLPFHPTDPRLATTFRLGKSDYDAQNGYILADGHVPPKCARRVEFSAVSRSSRRAWKSHRAWRAPPPDEWWVADVQVAKRQEGA
eukprot:4469559-Alexandrium_andersonii.AAC.1